MCAYFKLVYVCVAQFKIPVCVHVYVYVDLIWCEICVCGVFCPVQAFQ